MKVKNFLIIKAIVSLAFGIALALVPAELMNLFGVALNSTGAFMSRFVGACLIGIGLVCWFGKGLGADAKRRITFSLFIGDTIGTIVALVGQLRGMMNPLGWVIVAIWLLLALGNGYSRFIKLGS